MTSIIAYFKLILIVQLFYAFAITSVTYSLPAEELTRVTMFSGPSVSLSDVGSDLEGSLDSQIDLPLIDVGALVYYSGNIVIDLLLNFMTAIPQMVSLFVGAFMFFFNVEGYLATQIKLFLWVTILALYVVSMLSFVMNVRSGAQVV